MIIVERAEKIVIPPQWEKKLLAHCLRKYRKKYQHDETPERKAYGLIGGTQEGGVIRLGGVFPLRKNKRFDDAYVRYMDEMMSQYAVESKTPFIRRGWVADPEEVMKIYAECARLKIHQFGTYHMHLVAWKDDPIRDTCTEIDTILSQGSNSVMFIISLVDPKRPILRAFYEGKNDREIPIDFS